MILFACVHHIRIVVQDLEKSLAYYLSIGVGPWFDYPKDGTYLEFDVPNRGASDAMRYKCVHLANLQIQLCQPGPQDTPQRRFLEGHGEGVYDIGFGVRRDAAESPGRALGLKMCSRPARPVRLLQFRHPPMPTSPALQSSESRNGSRLQPRDCIRSISYISS